MNTGDTAFMLIATALVFFMTPGLAFFYGGLVRRKNVCNTMMACVAIMGLSVVLWTLFGYSLAFGGNHGGIIGDFRWIALNGVGWEAGPYADTIPHLLFCAFQMMFAMITPALITGSLVGRMKFKALFLFVTLWSFVVYYPLAHMVWGEGGLLAAIGSVDFAGGDVVHISSGISALVLAIILGRRRGYEQVTYRIHNIPFVVLGASLLWFGWFGFNAGSALAADGLAVHAFMTSAISAAAALLSWMFIDVVKEGKPTLVGASTGIFAQKSINSTAKWDGLVFGDYRLFLAQLEGILITIVIAVAGTLLCVAVVRIFTPLRVSLKEEQLGLDVTQHGENAYPSFNGLDQ